MLSPILWLSIILASIEVFLSMWSRVASDLAAREFVSAQSDWRLALAPQPNLPVLIDVGMLGQAHSIKRRQEEHPLQAHVEMASSSMENPVTGFKLPPEWKSSTSPPIGPSDPCNAAQASLYTASEERQTRAVGATGKALRAAAR